MKIKCLIGGILAGLCVPGLLFLVGYLFREFPEKAIIYLDIHILPVLGLAVVAVPSTLVGVVAYEHCVKYWEKKNNEREVRRKA